ncbi:MAG: hypothetical protein NVS2B12_34900 [Ktedonobacteraceae bacterium]
MFHVKHLSYKPTSLSTLYFKEHASDGKVTSVQSQTRPDSEFVVDLLRTLRNERFSLRGWYRFLGRSWDMSWKTARANPALLRSWLLVTSSMTTVALALLICNGSIEGWGAALRSASITLLGVAWQASDVFWHLGLHRHTQTGQLLQRIGWANIFTQSRGIGTAFLLGRYTGGLTTPTSLLLTIFLYGIVTDILDGQIARRTQTESKLGRILDAETDFCQYLVIALLLVQNRLLSPWMLLIFLLRFCLPLLAAVGSYFLFAQPVRLGSTLWGKCTGVVQSSYLIILMFPPNFHAITQSLQEPLLIATLLFLLGAPIALLAANVRERKRAG